MCGRYAIMETNELQGRFDLAETPPELAPRYNVAPRQTLPTIVRHSPNSVALMRWGFIPFWAKEAAMGDRMINARAETVAEKPAYRRAFRTQRCLVPASGFYEWRRTEQGKQPYFIHLADAPLFAFAGLYDTWRDPAGAEIQTYTIITTAANDLMAPIHDRMPVILDPDDEDLWLDPDATEPERLLPLLRPYPAAAMAAHPVSRSVNSPVNDHADLVQPDVNSK